MKTVAITPVHLQFQLCLAALAQLCHSLPLMTTADKEQQRQLLLQLLGTRHQHHFLPTWNHCQGALRQLLYYFSLEMQRPGAGAERQRLMATMHHEAESLTAGCKDLLERLDDDDGAPRPTSHPAAIAALRDNANTLQEALLLWARDHSGDENILLYLTANMPQLTNAFGISYCQRLIDALRGPADDLAEYLCKRYTSRGFQDLLAKIPLQVAHCQECLTP